MSHTPGPWSFDGDYVESLALLKPLFKPLSVATLADCGHNTEGNGILIAAAPELLAALKRLLPLWEESIGWEKNYMDMADDARAAIAKAEGKGE